MMSSRLYWIACFTLMLTGCAGMKDDFDCKAVANDSCMTMRQADEIARNADDTSGAQARSAPTGGTGRARLPDLIDLSHALKPVRMARQPVMPLRTLGYTSSGSLIPDVGSGVKAFPAAVPGGTASTATPVAVAVTAPIPSRACTPTDCPPSMPAPQREIETVVSLWIAPYVDGIEAVHAPAEVFFVRKPTEWRARYVP